MGDSDVICVQSAPPRGKWHMPNHNHKKTACREEIPMGAPRRALDLVDSGDRCLSMECREARAKARGLTT